MAATDRQSPWRQLGVPVAITFPVKNVAVDVRHLLGEVPDGFQVIDADCLVKRAPGTQFTKTIAFLMSDSDNASAVLAFGVLREAVTRVDAT